MAAFKVDAIDTLGAGDTFHGAFAFRLLETGDVVASMRFAAAAAAIKLTRLFFRRTGRAARRAGADKILRRNCPTARRAAEVVSNYRHHGKGHNDDVDFPHALFPRQAEQWPQPDADQATG